MDRHLPRTFALIAGLSLVFLYAPILVLGAFSFNGGRLFHRWEGFSFDWYARAIANEGFRDAAVNTLVVSTAATLLATVLATGAAIGLHRADGRQQRVAAALIGLPLVVPEIVMAIATLIFFSSLRNATGIDLGLGNLVVAHTAFCVPFAMMPIRAALRGVDPSVLTAAMDLYASDTATLRHVLVPLLMPGIGSGAALAFMVSFDDFAMSQLVAGPGQTTLPVFIWAQLKRPLTPEINAMSTIMLVVSIALICLSMAATARGRLNTR
jgi:spermidine/putrescine transport system permease protein